MIARTNGFYFPLTGHPESDSGPGKNVLAQACRRQGHARKLVSVSLDEHTVTFYDNDTPDQGRPRRSTTDLNRTKTKHQITASFQP